MKLGGCIDLNMSYTVPQKFLSLKIGNSEKNRSVVDLLL